MPPRAIFDSHAMECDSFHSCSEPISPKPRRIVTFAVANEINEIVHLNELREMNVVGDIWFDAKELKTIRFNCRHMVECFENGIGVDSDEIRGLEERTTQSRRRRRDRRHRAVAAVLDEQRLQRAEGMSDPDFLADVYFDFSLECQRVACQVGVADQKAVEC